MKYIWPPVMGAIEKRRKEIADGIAAGEKGQRELAEARHGSEAILAEARQKAMQVTDLAGKRGNELIAEAKNTAMAEGQRLVSQARSEIANEQNRARDGLRKEVSALALAGAAKLLGREVDAAAHARLLDELAAELEKGAASRG
jgi:F-type H+-transporting ATPase subunit b